MTTLTLKRKVSVPFPSLVTGTGGIKVVKSNGFWSISPDFAAIAALSATAVSNPSLKQVWIWDPVSGEYNVLTLAGLGDALYKFTSLSSLAVGAGSKTFATQAGKDIGVGSWAIATSDAAPATNYMLGQVTSYDASGNLVLNIVNYGGTGTHTDWTIRASSPPGSAGRSAGYSFAWLTSTANTDPGAGNIKANNATFGSITSIYLSETDADGNALAAEIATWVASTSTTKGRLKIYDPINPANFMSFDVTARADNGAWDTLTVAPVSSGGAFTDTLALRVMFLAKGDKGDTGVTGTAGVNTGVPYSFATATAMADPSSGNVRLNNATIASVTAIAISANSADSGNPSLSAWINTFDDSSTTAHRGYVILRKVTAPQNFAIFDVTGALTDNATWLQLAVTHVRSNGAFAAADILSVEFARTGDAGAGTVAGQANHGVAIGSGATSLGSNVVLTDGQLVVGATGVDPTAKTLSGDATLSAAGALTIANNAVTNAKLAAVNQFGKQSIWVPAAAMKVRVTNGATPANTETATNKVQIYGLDFDPSTNQFAQFPVWMPKSYDAGTLTAIFVWEHPATATNFAVVWGIQAFALGDNAALDTAFGTAQEVTDTGGTTNNQYVSPETAAMTIANTPAAEKPVVFQVYRNAAAGGDTLAVNARLIGVRILYNTAAQNDT